MKWMLSAGWSPALLDDGDRVAGRDRGALGYTELLDGARAGRRDLVLHLHRLDHADQRAGLYLGALLHVHLQDGALQRRDQLAVGGRAAAAARALTALGLGTRRGAVRRD